MTPHLSLFWVSHDIYGSVLKYDCTVCQIKFSCADSNTPQRVAAEQRHRELKYLCSLFKYCFGFPLKMLFNVEVTAAGGKLSKTKLTSSSVSLQCPLVTGQFSETTGHSAESV